MNSTILVVDDTPENIHLLSGVLRPDYVVKAATSGARALALAMTDSPPDLILLDIMMPEMDGYEVCRRLKADLRTRRIPVIFVTAMSEVQDEALGFEVGAVDYITKPVSPPIVRARVATHLALYQQEVALWKQVRAQNEELINTRLAVIESLGVAAEYKDDNTGGHVIRMSSYSRVLGLAAGLSEIDAEMLFTAAPMHDIGKIGIPDSILKKAGQLDAAEWEIMKKHVQYGAEILARHQNAELFQLARTIILSHHEMWDGTGYPQALRGEEIPFAGRIIAIADVFDALTSERPYKKAWPVEAAVSEIQRRAGKHFDPALVALLPTVLDEFAKIRQRFADSAPVVH